VSLELLLIKCRNLYRLSNEKCVLTLDFHTVLISLKIARTVHISSAVRDCCSFTLEHLEKKNIAPRISELLGIATGPFPDFL
jgi:hypothetical protein